MLAYETRSTLPSLFIANTFSFIWSNCLLLASSSVASNVAGEKMFSWFTSCFLLLLGVGQNLYKNLPELHTDGWTPPFIVKPGPQTQIPKAQPQPSQIQIHYLMKMTWLWWITEGYSWRQQNNSRWSHYLLVSRHSVHNSSIFEDLITS